MLQIQKVATFLGSIPLSSDTVESEGRQIKQCLKKYLKNIKDLTYFTLTQNVLSYLRK